MDWVSVEYLDGNNIGKRYRVSVRKKKDME